MTQYKTILIKAFPQPLIEAFKADEALSPGHLLEITTTGVKLHAGDGLKCYALVALEDTTQGKVIGDAYVIATQVQCAWLRTGDIFYGRLYNGESVAKGEYLESKGDGTLKKVVADTSAGTIKVGSLKFIADEACDMSSSAGVDPTGGFLRVRVIS